MVLAVCRARLLQSSVFCSHLFEGGHWWDRVGNKLARERGFEAEFEIGTQSGCFFSIFSNILIFSKGAL